MLAAGIRLFYYCKLILGNINCCCFFFFLAAGGILFIYYSIFPDESERAGG